MMIDEQWLAWWEMASYVVTVVGLPLAIYTLWRESRIERANEQHEIEQRDEEIYVQLSEQYAEFLELLLQHPDLQLQSPVARTAPLNAEQQTRQQILFDILIALFERAFLLLYEEPMDAAAQRRWQSWADYIRWWGVRPDFRAWLLAGGLDGEDANFAAYVRAMAGIGTEGNSA